MEDKLTINRAYASHYTTKKQAEELSKLRDKYGDVELESESSTSEEEDESAEGVTPQVERDFLRTLSLIKNKDPRIYDTDTAFFSSDAHPQVKKNKTEKKAMYLRDYERERLLEKGSLAEVSDSESDLEREKAKHQPTYAEEQQMLKDSFKKAVAETEGAGDLLSLRVKKEDASDVAPLRRYWTDPRLDPDEVFLRDFILNKGYIDKDATRIPTYDEIVDDESDQPGDSEDEEALDKQEDFERKFNFRFEEPDGDLIMSYPRTVSVSVRREDERRRKKRKEREERKAKEKDTKKEELKRLKNLKRKEIMDKLEKLKEITGSTAGGFKEMDIDGDFDPAHYDKMMKTVFDEDYYAEPEGKPVFSDVEDDDAVNWDEWQPHHEGAHCEDPGFNMDADSLIEAEESFRKKRKKTAHLVTALSREKPTFDPAQKSFEEYFDEYYKLDYEDVIGDMPCRFKYRSVVPNDFGLATEEVLSWDDKELNRWVSLKKSVRIRTEEEEKKDRKRFRKKAMKHKRRLRLLQSAQDQLTRLPKRLSSKEGKGKTDKRRKGKGKSNQKASISNARMKSYGLT